MFLDDRGGSGGRDRRRHGLGERMSIYRKHHGPLVGNDLRHGCDWQQAPTPDENALATNRDSVTAGAGDFDERPDTRPLSVEDGVPLRRSSIARICAGSLPLDIATSVMAA